jgi:flagellin
MAGSTASFTISSGTTALVFSQDASASVAAVAVGLQTAATTANISANVYEQADITFTNIVAGDSVKLGEQDFTATGSTAALALESVMNAINSAVYTTGVVSSATETGFIRAELNSGGTAISVRIRNETATQVTVANNSTTTTLDVAVGTGGAATLAVATTANSGLQQAISGQIAFEATGTNEVSVVTTNTSASLTAIAGSITGSSVGGSALSSTNETDISVAVGGKDVSPSALSANSTVSQLASAVNGVDGVSAYEEIGLTISASTLESGEALRFNGDGVNVDVTATPDKDGNFTLASLVDDINGKSFSTAKLDVTASLSSDGTTIDLTIKNYSAAVVTLESENANGGGVVVAEGAGTFIGEQAQALSGELRFASDDGQDVSVTLSDPTTGGELFATKSQSSEFKGVNGLQDGDVLINDVTIGGALTGADTASATVSSDGERILSSEKGLSAIAVAAAINKVSEETGVSASVNETKVVGGDGTGVVSASFEQGDQAGLYINGVNIGSVTLQNEGSATSVDTDRARADTLNLINQNAGKTGVTATDNGISLTLIAADGRNISIAIDDKAGSDNSIGALLGLDSSVKGIGEATFGGNSSTIANAPTSAEASTYETTYGTVKLESAKEFKVEGGANGNDELAALGLTAGTYGGGEDGQFLNEIDITSIEGATAALTAIDNAISQVASQRADLGAVQNRLESTVSGLQVTSENLNAANSRIQDADFASETAELQRTNVLQQAGISILAQANASGQQVLSLLG